MQEKSIKRKRIKKKVVIGVMGSIASGKGIVARFLKKNYGFNVINMGNLIRIEAKKRKIPINRENLHNLQAELRKEKPHYFIKKVIEKINKSRKRKWVVDGVRNPDQAELLKKKFNALLIYIDAPQKLRWERARKRHRKEEAKESFMDFVRKEREENKIFKFNKTKSYADYIIINDKTKRELHKKLKNLFNYLL